MTRRLHDGHTNITRPPRTPFAQPLIQRQLGHAYLSTTGTYLEGISSGEIVGAVHGRKAPMMHASAGLEL